MKKVLTIASAIFLFSLSMIAQPPCPDGEVSMIVSILTDGYGYETGWEVIGTSGTVYGSIEPDSYANNTLYETQVCIPAGECVTFSIEDTYGDGIFAPGYYVVALEGDTVATGYNFGSFISHNLNCEVGQVCEEAIPVTEGVYTTEYDNNWYVFSPDSVGTYQITTCGYNECDTKIWVYETCEGIGLEEDNKATIFFDDDQGGCAPQAVVHGFFAPGQTYYIRIGDNLDACNDTITWELIYEGQVVGCTDPNSCNYNPLATIDDGSCLPQGDPDCPEAPDLLMREDVLTNSLVVGQVEANDECLIEEGCLNGYGTRDVIRFSTRIDNIGALDYFIGQPNTGNTQFTWNNCHNHFHYDGYAEYVLFDEYGNLIPIGFKNGFCVIDLGCTTGSGQYGCGNMGISAGCYDEYWAGLSCQWIDVTDIPDGNYIFVTRVNWDNAPDKLGRLESDSLNNWAQVCINIDRSSGSLELGIEEDCEPYVDCEGTLYGSAQVDCEGVCDGGAVMGDLNGDGELLMGDALEYVTMILGEDIEPTTCNDLNGDGEITVYDATLVSSCLNYGAGHVHPGEGLHDHCQFPGGIVNTTDTVDLTILDANLEEQYFDIGIRNPTAYVNAYQFKMSGLQIQEVENLVDPGVYPMTPQSTINGGVIIGISYQDSLINKSPEWQPLCRIHYSEVTDDVICLEEITDIVNGKYEQTVNRIIEESCVIVNDIEVIDLHIAVKVQPNPFTDNTLLTFPNPGAKEHTLELMDMSGRIVRQFRNITADQVTIERSTLSSGIYLYRLTGATGFASGKITVQ